MTFSASTSPHLEALERDGYTTVAGVFSPDEVQALLAGLESALASTLAADPAIRGGEGTVFAARNVMRLWPRTASVWRRPALLDALTSALGDDFGLVRALYFDKPPGKSWALPWHKDLTVALKHNRLGGTHFARPTRKAGQGRARIAPRGQVAAPRRPRRHVARGRR